MLAGVCSTVECRGIVSRHWNVGMLVIETASPVQRGRTPTNLDSRIDSNAGQRVSTNDTCVGEGACSTSSWASRHVVAVLGTRVPVPSVCAQFCVHSSGCWSRRLSRLYVGPFHTQNYFLFSFVAEVCVWCNIVRQEPLCALV